MPDPRIPMLSPEEALEAAETVGVSAQFAELSVFRTLLHQPGVARALQDLLLTLLSRGKLDARLRELVILRIGWATGSAYEWAQHWRIARLLGIGEEELLAVRDWRSAPRLGAAEHAVLAATDETLESGTISAATWAACERHVGGREELIELVAAIGCWRLFSSLLRSLEIPLEAGVEAWPPDGRSPAASAGSARSEP